MSSRSPGGLRPLPAKSEGVFCKDDVGEYRPAVARVEILLNEPLRIDQVPAQYVERNREATVHGHVRAQRV